MSVLLIKQYHTEVDKIICYGGSRKETSIRVAFQNLLNEYCKPREFLLIPELDYKTPHGKVVYPDGTVKDALRLDWGYWESKDKYDNLDQEIEKKLNKGYPDSNILFEDSQTAVLIQCGNESMRVPMKDAEALDEIITSFINYVRPEVKDFREAIEIFKQDLPTILKALRDLIDKQADSNLNFQKAVDNFWGICKQSINPEINLLDVREMMIQHILTEDIFINIFNESQFHRENNIARELQNVVETFFKGTVKRNTLSTIERYYGVIRRTAANIYNHHEKQRFLKALYENFYKAYNPKAADRLGIVYTPNEIVRFMVESVDYLTHKHFGKLLADKNVEILDPATGTGTFITELIEYLPKASLEYKYKHEIHCNEVAILPYYTANLNIEYTYKQKMGVYEEFDNICFVDTLEHTSFEGKQLDLFAMSVENTERIKRQNESTISVIIGNPPYNAKQENFNDNNANRAYPEVDKRIKQTYVKNGTAQNQIVLYDMYVRIPDLHLCASVDAFQCLPLYHYDEEGNRIDNITDWGLEQFQTHYKNFAIAKEDIFYYTYAVLHNPEYRQKYEINLKREFPRLPFYDDFYQWVNWGMLLMDLHINYENVTPYQLKRIDIPLEKPRSPKVKLKADKTNGKIIIDDITSVKGVPKEAWEYRLGNRSALEWILDQYKEKKIKDPTIAEKFNTYRFADYKEQVIDSLLRVCTVSVKTMGIIQAMS